MAGSGKRSESRLQLTVLTTLLLTGLLLQNLLWFQPATLLPVIAEDLNLSYSQSGLSVSVLCLLAAIAGPFAGVFLIRAGLKHTFTLALLFLATGTTGTLFAHNFNVLLIMRILVGIGIGLTIPIPGVAAVSWFSEKRRPLLNSVYAALPYVATALNFGVSVRLFRAFDNNWKLTLAAPGLLLFVIAFFWLLQKQVRYDTSEVEDNKGISLGGITEILKDKQVRLICLAEACDMWGFEFLSSYLITYLHESGLSLDKAAAYSTIFPVSGIIACLVCGALMVYTGKRKIFTWPMHLTIFAGTLLIVFGTGYLQILGIFLAGFGNAGWAPALFTMPMEFKNTTAEKVGLVYSFMFSLGYLAAFISPPLGGRIAQIVGLKFTIAIFAFFALLAAICMFNMDETHGERNGKRN